MKPMVPIDYIIFVLGVANLSLAVLSLQRKQWICGGCALAVGLTFIAMPILAAVGYVGGEP